MVNNHVANRGNIDMIIYEARNKINGKRYIGQTIHTLEERKRGHISSMCCSYFRRALDKYGVDSFEWNIIDTAETRDELNRKESYWIEFYDTFFNGYNQTFGGDTTSQQPKEKIIGVINDLLNTNMLHREIAEKWNISTEMVQGINTGRYWKHNADYPLQKQHKQREYDNPRIHFCIKCGKKKSNKGSLCLECYNKEKSSNIPDKEKLYNELYECNGNFTMISKIYGVSDNTIRKWCIKYGIPYHSSDYKEKNIILIFIVHSPY